MSKQHIRGDKVIAFAVMIQSLLIVLQTIMIGCFHMNADSTTKYRVVLTAIPMIAAIMVALNRNPLRFFIGYAVAVFLLVFTMVFFPDNTPFVTSQGLRFFLPVVLPSFLCLTVVYDFSVIEKTLYVVSWLTMALVTLYIFGIFSGIVVVESYNMALSFACVLPFVVFYSHRMYYDYIVCLVLFVLVVAIGARGAALCMAGYVVFDMFQNRNKRRYVVLTIIIVFIVYLPLLNDWLYSIGISSRTLSMLFEGNIASDSGRSTIREFFINQLYEHPYLGLGLFGDRLYGESYCHNLILEVLIDFGIPLGGILLVIGLIKLISLFLRSDSNNRNRIIEYLCALLWPFMTSGSYLISSEFAIFIGLCYLINKNQTKTSNNACIA